MYGNRVRQRKAQAGASALREEYCRRRSSHVALLVDLRIRRFVVVVVVVVDLVVQCLCLGFCL